ncbi:MAG: DUF1003 domain-containing protein [Bryobacterales bacterium]|nr:DUF1003 domain-containing protein [Bryobacterales bacterium]
MGSVPFVVVHLLAVAAWVLVNTGWFGWIRPFDPYPFVLLTLAVL